ncbi:MAG: glycoside hydrolase family 28 protein [Duncaniella sp.]|nr:glycoside hydrolase family 28 protein [Duncaniella sp.]
MKKLLISLAILLCSAAASAGVNTVDSLRADILSRVSGAVMPEATASILDFGAKGDGKKDCKKAFDKAMQRAARKGGLHLTVPAGTYYIAGPITLTDNVCLDLAEGATLLFSPDAKDYPMVSTGWEGTYLQNYSPMIYARGCRNVSIIGRGTIDGNAGETFAKWKPLQRPGLQRSRDMNHSETPVEERNFGEGWYLRPHHIQFYECEGVTVEGVKITNSPFWCLHLLKSSNIILRGIRYDAKLVNNDGIDPESSRDILIEDIHFNNGDDNIAIKSGRDNDGWRLGAPTENILIRNCRFKGLHAVVIGSEMSGGVRNIIVEDCGYAGYVKRGIYVKTNPDRGAFVENIYVRNVTLGEVEDLFYVTSKYAGEGLDNDKFTRIRGIHVDGLRCTKASGAALVLQGTAREPVTDVTFDRVTVGEARTGISFSDTRNVRIDNSVIGTPAGVPTQVSAKDKIFER